MALVTSAVIVAGATVASYTQQRKAAKAQAKAQRAQQRQAEIANARERRAAVRAGRVARASVESQAAVTGITGSSGEAGSVANITSETNSNVSFLDQNAMLSEEASRANQQAADYASRAQGYADLAKLAGKAGKVYGG